MFTKKYRLNLAVQLKNPKFYKTPFFTLLVSQNELSYSRFGFIAAKKNDKRAVARNRIKRFFSTCLQSEKIKPGYDMLFVIKKDSFLKPSYEVGENIKETLVKGDFV